MKTQNMLFEMTYINKLLNSAKWDSVLYNTHDGIYTIVRMNGLGVMEKKQFRRKGMMIRFLRKEAERWVN